MTKKPVMQSLHKITIILIFTVILQSNKNAEEDSRLSTSGVSTELATVRKAGIKDVVYSIHFDIPTQSTEKIDGSLCINFTLDNKKYPHPLILDFKAELSNLLDVSINGKEATYIFENEHIILPSEFIINGKNKIDINFIAGEKPLNRNKDYIYTLLVPDRARTLFPCFDQPDIKGIYKLTLSVPQSWEAIGNAPIEKESSFSERRNISFKPTEPLSTYLFSFVTGAFNASEHKKNNRVIKIYHRESEQHKTDQLPAIANQIFTSLEWMEEYTKIKYPFEKYDIILLPGFQFGGMEHTGATLYNNTRIILPPNPSLEQKIAQTSLIAHETAHMWFGNYVTMDWFSGVWIKEVFANFFASKICQKIFPDINFKISELDFYSSAYSEDRTMGATSIQQDLSNLKYAGLIYNRIIYDKSPIVMEMLYSKIGAENFRLATCEYLNTYAYSNASWNNIIDIFAKYQPNEFINTTADIREWSKYWVYGKMMPEISIERGCITGLNDAMQTLHTDTIDSYVIPNMDGKFYGYIKLDQPTYDYILTNLYSSKLNKTGIAKKSLLIVLHENWIRKNIDSNKYMKALCDYLIIEKDPQIFPSILNNISAICKTETISNDYREHAETKLWEYISNDGKYATQAFMIFNEIAFSPIHLNTIYDIWQSEKTKISNLKLSQRDFILLSYQLAIKLPIIMGNDSSSSASKIIETQRNRLTNKDIIREFEFISRGTTSDTAKLDGLFESLLLVENRRTEPWAQQLLALLNHPLRQNHALKYIIPALNALPEIQMTGDIFFPMMWINSLLKGHNSHEAATMVEDYLNQNPDILQLLRNKVLQNAFHLIPQQ